MPSLLISSRISAFGLVPTLLLALLLTVASVSPILAQQDAPAIVEAGEPASIIDIEEEADRNKPFRIGMMAERGGTYLLERMEPFRRYIEDMLLRPVEIVPFGDIRLLISAHSSKQIDYARYPASTFAMAQAACGCLMPLVAPTSNSAPDGIYMIMLVNADSPFKSLGDLTGGNLALSSRKGAVPYHMALNEMRLAGLDPDRDMASILVKDNPSEALNMLETGAVDAALVWSATPLNQLLLSRPGAVSAYAEARRRKNRNAKDPDFLTIWQTRPIPAGPHVVHRDLSKQDRATLITALKAMNQQAPEAYDAVERVHNGGFRAVSLEDYQPLISIATAQ